MTAAELEIIIKAEVQNAVSNLSKVDKALVKTGQAASNVSKKAGKDFTGLSRVIQDLPYGFNAISNNLTQLLPAAGAAGLAFSAIVTAVTFAQVGFGAWTRGIGETSKQLSAFNDEMAKSVASASTEAAKINALVAVARNLSESTETRKNAIKELQKEYPGYLSNINLENINSQEAKNAINGLTNALVRKAKVQAITNLLTKSNEELTKAQNQSLAESGNIIDKLILKLGGKGIIGFGALRESSAAKQDAINAAQSDVDAYTNALNAEVAKQAENNDFELTDPTKIKTKAVKDAAIYVNAFIKGRSNLDNVTAVENGRFITNQIQKGLDSGPVLKIPPFDFDKTDIANKAAELGAIVRDTLINSFAAIGEAIGNIITGAANPFAALFSVIGGGMKALGKQMIEYAVLQKIMLTALGSLNPFLSLAAGIALTALGTAISNMGAVKKFASGGLVTQPTLALVGERGPERITPLGYEGQAGNIMQGAVQFVIRGQDLYGTLNRFNQNNRNIN